MKILVTGGGSGGHISPALAVIDMLRREHVELLYVGGKLTMEGATGSSIEEQMVMPTGTPYISISAGKLPRQVLGLQTLRRLWGVVPGCVEALQVVRKFGPDVVFSTGGYVTLPVVLAARLLNIPVVIHEQTAAVGLTNKIASHFATLVAITFPSSSKYFPARKTVLTGNPIRAEILRPPAEAPVTPLMDWLRQPGLPLIYVTGGGLGSHVINLQVMATLETLLTHYRVIHQCGSHSGFEDFSRAIDAKNSLPNELQLRYWPAEKFTTVEVGRIYQSIAMAVARAGANTVLELAAWGIPTIFIPIPWVTHDEQTKNAQLLVDVGLAIILPEQHLAAASLVGALSEMQHRLPHLAEAKRQARTYVKPDAAARLVRIIMASAKK
jgi:UDP-N-acetylglucosamine--N-acetylmuramyl-(pentapeptide) pyrophosphoryl-undecaprenol N-acetylglucosamine transferase